MADVSNSKRNSLTNKDIDWLVPHQANRRIIDATASRMNLEESKVLMNIEKYGNTTSATLPLVLMILIYLKKGYNYFAAFGMDFMGIYLFKWAYDKNKFKLKQIIMDLKEIQNLIKFVANSGVAEELEMDDVKSPSEQL
jgi:hypothetical protein